MKIKYCKLYDNSRIYLLNRNLSFVNLIYTCDRISFICHAVLNKVLNVKHEFNTIYVYPILYFFKSTTKYDEIYIDSYSLTLKIGKWNICSTLLSYGYFSGSISFEINFDLMYQDSILYCKILFKKNCYRVI